MIPIPAFRWVNDLRTLRVCQRLHLIKASKVSRSVFTVDQYVDLRHDTVDSQFSAMELSRVLCCSEVGHMTRLIVDIIPWA